MWDLRDPSSPLRMLTQCYHTRLSVVLPDHRPRPPRDRGNDCVVTDRKSPLQVVDQSVDYIAFVFADAHHAPQALHLSGVATGFSDCDRPVVFVDPVADLKTALEQQLQEVFGLTVICRHRSGGLALIDGRRLFRPVNVRKPPGAQIHPGGGMRIARSTLVG